MLVKRLQIDLELSPLGADHLFEFCQTSISDALVGGLFEVEGDEAELEALAEEFGEVELVRGRAKEEALREVREQLLGRLDLEQGDRAGVLNFDLGFTEVVPRNPDQIERPAESLVDAEGLDDGLTAFGVGDEEIFPFGQKHVQGFLLGFVVGKGDLVGMGMCHGSDLRPMGR